MEMKIKNTKKNNQTTQVSTSNIDMLIEKKFVFFNDIIQKTTLYIQKLKQNEVLVISDVNNCLNSLVTLNNNLKKNIANKRNNTTNSDQIINNLQTINNDLSTLFKVFGTQDLEDLLTICLGSNSSINNQNYSDNILSSKLKLLKCFFHPICYRLIENCQENNNFKNLICTDICDTNKIFFNKLYGIKLHIANNDLTKGLIITGYLDDPIIDFIDYDNSYINNLKNDISKNKPQEQEFVGEVFERFLSSLNLKDYLVNNYSDIFGKYMGYLNQIKLLTNKTISQNIKDFINNDTYIKRLTIIQLLIMSNNHENLYLAYLLYDLLSSESNNSTDTIEQNIIYDSFPWSVKDYFKDAMKKTIQYTNDLSNFDINKIPLDQQICLLKAPDSVKEKAMLKLKEVKAKSEDSGSKARQYIDGLLKIPFGIYKREPILDQMNIIRGQFKNIYTKYKIKECIPDISEREKYTSIEILKYIKQIKEHFDSNSINSLLNYMIEGDKKKLNENINILNNILTKSGNKNLLIKTTGLKKQLLKEEIHSLIKNITPSEKQLQNTEIITNICNTFSHLSKNSGEMPINKDIDLLELNIKTVNEYIKNVRKTLDNVVYGHDKAKQQIERIIAQWINGENTAYCCGFEGNPGIGKTTLAKGLSNCLKDENGNSRPFALIAIGGDANSSSLVGHSYTYVGSTWGQIVQILMDKKCMNPIILIDEIDKVSKTEHGKEIIGILTHLLDPTQNDTFQDKYFSGIDLDLSKVLFILSYNDAELIDRILLDRVHRIQFDSLSIEDKIVISNNYLLPEIYKNNGLENVIHIDDNVLKFIIEEYTLEPGVRKLKEKLYEIVGEINLDILKEKINPHETVLPINITIDCIKNKYFKNKREARLQKIHSENKVGVINCLWANVYNVGGILSASAKFFPSDKFLELKLTGLLDQMMQESFQISLTLAYNLLNDERKKELMEKYNGTHKYGIHLHMGDGSVNKSGTSAGIAITLLLYSLLNNKKIKNDFAVTGEACDLNGKVGEIGALKTKIVYGIKSGVKNFIYPEENKKDFDDFIEKYGKSDLINGINFYSVNHVDEAIKLIMDEYE